MLGGCFVHRRHSPGGALRLGPRGHFGVRHIAGCLPAQLGKTGLGNARQRHVGVGNEERPFVQGLHGLLHGPGRKAQVFGVVKIRRGVDDPPDNGFRLRRRGQAHLGQLCGNHFQARPLNVSGQMVLRRQYSIPFRAGTPFW